MLVDLTGVEFCSAAGATVIQQSHEAARSAAVDYLLLASPAVARVMTVTGLDHSVAMTTDSTDSTDTTDTLGGDGASWGERLVPGL